jgi:hypothetical protein
MQNLSTPKLKCEGAALILAVLAMTLLLIIGAALLTLGFQSRALQIHTSSDIVARCAADAGLTKVLYEINQQLQTGQLNPDNFPQAIDVPLQGSDSTFSYQVEQIDGKYVLEATGISNGVQRTVQATLILSNPFDFAIFAVDKVTMQNGSLIDWYNYTEEDDKMKVGTNSTNSGAIDLKNSITINGDVAVGFGGNPDDVVLVKNGSVVTGDIYALTSTNTLQSVIVPEYLQDLPPGDSITGNKTLYNSGRYDEVDLGNSKTITVQGPVEIYVTGDITLDNSSSIVIDESVQDSSLTVYLAGNLDSKNSCTINNNTEIPRNFKLYGLDTCTSLDFRNSSDFYGLIYAPCADVVFHNSVDIYGSVIGKTIDLKNSANVYYDASLRQTQDDDELVKLKIDRWSE